MAHKIPVYREKQPSSWSPCLLGDRCPACELNWAHRDCKDSARCNNCFHGRTKHWECEREQPAAPAFTLPFIQAKALVSNGLARFINRNIALRLTFSTFGNLRDRSCKIDPAFLLAYAAGETWALN